MTIPSQPSGEDWDLIQKINSGDAAAFEILFRRHKDRVYHLALRFTRNASASEDVVQEVFIRVHAGKARPQTSVRFTTWLYRVAANLATDWLRRRRWTAWFGGAPELSDDADPSDSARETLEKSETRALVQRAIQRLPEHLRLPLVLYQFEDLSYREIASILGLSPKAVERRLYHAKEKLRANLNLSVD